MLVYDGLESVVGLWYAGDGFWYVFLHQFLFFIRYLLQVYMSFQVNGFFQASTNSGDSSRDGLIRKIQMWSLIYRSPLKVHSDVWKVGLWAMEDEFVFFICIIDFCAERFRFGSSLSWYNQMKCGIKWVILSCWTCWKRKYMALLFVGPNIVIQYCDCIV